MDWVHQDTIFPVGLHHTVALRHNAFFAHVVDPWGTQTLGHVDSDKVGHIHHMQLKMTVPVHKVGSSSVAVDVVAIGVGQGQSTKVELQAVVRQKVEVAACLLATC